MQAGHAVYGNVEVEQIEDSLITGAVTSKILKLKMAQYYSKDLSYCNWILRHFMFDAFCAIS